MAGISIQEYDRRRAEVLARIEGGLGYWRDNGGAMPAYAVAAMYEMIQRDAPMSLLGAPVAPPCCITCGATDRPLRRLRDAILPGGTPHDICEGCFDPAAYDPEHCGGAQSVPAWCDLEPVGSATVAPAPEPADPKLSGSCRFCGAGPREWSECEDVRCDIVEPGAAG